MNPLHAAFIAVIRRIPAGKVMSYGGVAAAAGLPRHARHVGVALKQLPEGSGVPWWRVVDGSGRIPARGFDGSDDLQRILLEDEGVRFSAAGRIKLAEFGFSAGD